jgi:MFS family permease
VRTLPTSCHVPAIPAGLALTGAAFSFTGVYLASGVLMPLLVLYQERWRLSAAQLTLAFAVFAIGFLAAVVTVGSLSDHVGRRPVLVGALIIQLTSNVLFFGASDVQWVIVARIVQGIATGTATAAFTASLVEHAPPNRKRLGSILASVSLTGGLAAGSLLAGTAIQLTTAPNAIVFITLIVITALSVVVVALSPETATRAPGALRSLIPRVAVPPPALTEFAAAVPVITAIWMLSGLAGGLAPSMVRSVFDLDSGLLNGLCGFLAPAASALATLLFARLEDRRLMMVGIYASIAGATGIACGAMLGILVVMFVGQGVAGAGFGASFAASLRLVLPLAATHQRAAVAAAIYLVSYIAFGVPVVVAGRMTACIGVVPTVICYSAASALLALVSLRAQSRLARRATALN